jgi:hypothetical protein
LLEHAGEVVTREELQQKLWPADTFTDFDHGLNNAINRLREALCDSADWPCYVETLPRRGYRFIAPVDLGACRERSPGVPNAGPPSPSGPSGRATGASPLSLEPQAGGEGVAADAAPTPAAHPQEPVLNAVVRAALQQEPSRAGAVHDPVPPTQRSLRAAALLAMLLVGIVVGCRERGRACRVPVPLVRRLMRPT